MVRRRVARAGIETVGTCNRTFRVTGCTAYPLNPAVTLEHAQRMAVHADQDLAALMAGAVYLLSYIARATAPSSPTDWEIRIVSPRPQWTGEYAYSPVSSPTDWEYAWPRDVHFCVAFPETDWYK